MMIIPGDTKNQRALKKLLRTVDMKRRKSCRKSPLQDLSAL